MLSIKIIGTYDFLLTGSTVKSPLQIHNCVLILDFLFYSSTVGNRCCPLVRLFWIAGAFQGSTVFVQDLWQGVHPQGLPHPS